MCCRARSSLSWMKFCCLRTEKGKSIFNSFCDLAQATKSSLSSLMFVTMKSRVFLMHASQPSAYVNITASYFVKSRTSYSLAILVNRLDSFSQISLEVREQERLVKRTLRKT